jgi:hypothetical protein
MMLRLFFILIPLMFPVFLRAQGCCSGGSGSPIAGGASQGVLQERQFEISSNYQYQGTGRFMSGDSDTTILFDLLKSNYLYGRLAYGVTDRLTMSIESGYFIDKSQYGLERKDTVRSSGIADLIIFPRYSFYTRNTEFTKTELSAGLGLKMPLGKYNDSTVVFVNPKTGRKQYAIAPPTVQPTNGSNDFIFYGFAYRGYTETKFRVFMNMIYIRKGWNPLGQKFGDYMSIGLFAGQTAFKKLALTMQLRGEWIAPMEHHKDLDMLALYNIDVMSTGSRKLFIAPQASYSQGGFLFYALYELPVYQYMNGTQIASEHQVTAGISYRFFAK